jgi:hypothetical protein
VIALLEAALETVHMLQPAVSETMASDVFPQESPEPGTSLLRTLYHEVDQARTLARHLSERLIFRPADRFVRGQLLSVEEFHASHSAGVNISPNRAGLGLPAPAHVTDYELYRLLHYEDDHWIGMINPALAPRDLSSGFIGMRVGRPPEELLRAGLRPEQEAFFAEHMPEVLARFVVPPQ